MDKILHEAEIVEAFPKAILALQSIQYYVGNTPTTQASRFAMKPA